MPESYEAVDEHLVRLLPRLVDELGGDVERLLDRAGLSSRNFWEGASAPSYRQAIDVVALAASELNCEDFGMRLAAAQFGTIQSPLTRLIEHAGTLGEALELVCAHSYAHSRAVSIWLDRSADDESAVYGFDILLEGVPNWRQAMEQILLIAYLSIQQVTGFRVRARRVSFRHQRISPPEVYRRHFGCEVKFGQSADAIVFAADDLDCRIIRQGGEDVQDALAAIERRFPERQSPVHARVRGIVMNLLGSEACAIENVASKLGVSTKKLSRLLAAEGTSYQIIKNTMRIEIARYYIEETTLDFSLVSEKTGFAEQSALTHFCGKWLGGPPSELRLRARRAGQDRLGARCPK